MAEAEMDGVLFQLKEMEMKEEMTDPRWWTKPETNLPNVNQIWCAGNGANV